MIISQISAQHNRLNIHHKAKATTGIFTQFKLTALNTPTGTQKPARYQVIDHEHLLSRSRAEYTVYDTSDGLLGLG